MASVPGKRKTDQGRRLAINDHLSQALLTMLSRISLIHVNSA